MKISRLGNWEILVLDWRRLDSGGRKGKKAFQYRYDGMVAVLSNIPIFTGDAASR
jgi:putative DNA primase/helicase